MSTDEPPVRPRRSRNGAGQPSAVARAAKPNETRPAGTAKPGAKVVERGRSRTRGGGPVVAVTGAAHGIGEMLVRRLVDSAAVKKVIAIDTIRGDVTQATWRLVDVRDPVLADRLAGVDVVVHLAIAIGADDHSPERHAANVRGVATVLVAAPAAGVKHVVLLTSAMVYGAEPDNPVPLPEDAPLRARPDSDLLADLLEVERLAAQTARTQEGLRVTVVRPATLVGGGVDTVLTRHFEAPRLLAVKGSRTRWQFCHVDDLLSALEFVAVGPGAGSGAGAGVEAVVGAVVGVVVGSPGSLEQGDIERISGKRHIELPAAVAFGTAERLHRLGVTPASAGDLQYLVYPWVADGRRLAAAGWTPGFDNETALRAALTESSGRLAIGGHRLGRRDAAAGAAVGATVALVGTAALVRRARRRRG